MPKPILILLSLLIILLSVLSSMFVRAAFLVLIFCAALSWLLLIVGLIILCYIPREKQKPVFLILGAGIALSFFIGISNLPLRIAFRFARPRFEELARQVVDGHSPQTPFRVGIFTIHETGLRGDPPAAYFRTGGHSAEIDGFVRNPVGAGFNLFSHTRLDDQWSYLAED